MDATEIQVLVWTECEKLLPLLDISSAGCRINSIAHIPSRELADRTFELPPRNLSFGLLFDPTEDEQLLQDALNYLQGKNSSNNKNNKREPIPWRVEYVVMYNGTRQQPDNSSDDNTSTIFPQPRLWQPDSMIKNELLGILLQGNNNKVNIDNNNSSSRGEIWDLGAGAGRDTCYLAQELQQYTIVAMDQRYRDNTAITKFFQRRKVDNNTVVECINLQDLTAFKNRVEHSSETLSCIYAVRYWNRSLVEYIAKNESSRLQKGFVFAISQFGRPYTGAPWPHQHPSEKHVLDRHELADIFKDGPNKSSNAEQLTWRILCDTVTTDSDHGRPLIHFIAQLQ